MEHHPVETITFDLVGPGAPGGFRGYPNLGGPKSPTSSTGGTVLATLFTVGATGFNLDGYWFWCCSTGQDLTAPSFALWRATTIVNGVLIPAGTVAGNTMVAGQWNFTPVPVPVPLSAGTAYKAQVGLQNSFPFDSGWYGPAGPCWDGISNGPLLLYSGADASNPGPFGADQCTFIAGSGDPTVGYAASASGDFNGFLDVQVSTV